MDSKPFNSVFPEGFADSPVCLCSTVLDEEKAQQEERFRMEMRRQVTVSWDAGNSDEAPPKVRAPSAHSVTPSCVKRSDPDQI